MFAERGLGVTLDDIARAAGVGVGTVYRRFPDKGSLIDALFAQRIETLCDIADEALAVPDAWDALVFYFEKGSKLQARDRGLKELLSCSTHGGEPRRARPRRGCAPSSRRCSTAPRRPASCARTSSRSTRR